MVWVPLGTRPVQGVVFLLADDPQVDVVKDIIAPVEPSPLVAPIGLELADWISRYYMSSLFDAATLMLPSGFRTRVRSYLRDARRNRGTPSSLDAPQTRALELVSSRPMMGEREFLKGLGDGAEQELRKLLRRGLVERRWRLPGAKMSHRYDCFVRPAAGEEDQEVAVAALIGSRASRQLALYRALACSEGRIPVSLANKEYGPGVVAGLLSRGLVSLEWVRADREPPLQGGEQEWSAAEIVLTPAQERAVSEITSALEHPGRVGGPFLIHGVTGSGKTEVYLRGLERCVAMGKRGIYLVPEISMTPQTVHRLNARFSGRVAVLHSRLTTGQQFDQWWKIRNGEFDVVVGPRSALFAPLADLGLVVLDEEHEWTYKQQEASPRYHARSVALKLCELSRAILVMGSATPDVETYYGAKHGGSTLLELPRRIGHAGGGSVDGAGLARVEVCDMRRELKEGNRSIFSRRLAEALDECIQKGEQAVLFLNRRGSSTLVQCRDCGYAVRCRRCAVTLTYHASDSRLVCHHCNRRSNVPRGCPECRSPRIRYLGVGSQRVLDELRTLSPGVIALRWDRDTALDPRAHELIMGRFPPRRGAGLNRDTNGGEGAARAQRDPGGSSSGGRWAELARLSSRRKGLPTTLPGGRKGGQRRVPRQGYRSDLYAHPLCHSSCCQARLFPLVRPGDSLSPGTWESPIQPAHPHGLCPHQPHRVPTRDGEDGARDAPQGRLAGTDRRTGDRSGSSLSGAGPWQV